MVHTTSRKMSKNTFNFVFIAGHHAGGRSLKEVRFDIYPRRQLIQIFGPLPQFGFRLPAYSRARGLGAARRLRIDPQE